MVRACLEANRTEAQKNRIPSDDVAVGVEIGSAAKAGKPGPKPRPLADRWREKVAFTSDLFSCWLWTGAQNSDGYGTIWNGDSPSLAHVVSYRFALGEIPDGLELDHTCRVRHCVRPSHLEAVTHAENMRRRRPVSEWHRKPLTIASAPAIVDAAPANEVTP